MRIEKPYHIDFVKPCYGFTTAACRSMKSAAFHENQYDHSESIGPRSDRKLQIKKNAAGGMWQKQMRKRVTEKTEKKAAPPGVCRKNKQEKQQQKKQKKTERAARCLHSGPPQYIKLRLTAAAMDSSRRTAHPDSPS